MGCNTSKKRDGRNKKNEKYVTCKYTLTLKDIANKQADSEFIARTLRDGRAHYNMKQFLYRIFVYNFDENEDILKKFSTLTLLVSKTMTSRKNAGN